MKQLTNSRFLFSTMLVLGFFAAMTLSSCAGGGESDNSQKADKTEEAAPAEDMGEENDMPADATENTEAAADSTDHEGHDHEGHDHDEEHAEEGDEHPSGGSEHPN